MARDWRPWKSKICSRRQVTRTFSCFIESTREFLRSSYHETESEGACGNYREVRRTKKRVRETHRASGPLSKGRMRVLEAGFCLGKGLYRGRRYKGAVLPPPVSCKDSSFSHLFSRSLSPFFSHPLSLV